MKQFFSVKSPLWQLIAVALLYVTLLLALSDQQNSDAAGLNADRIGLLSMAAIVLVYTVIYSLFVKRYNDRHSTKDHVSLTGIKPAELRDEDEGMSMLTAKATGKVYRYHSFALPLVMTFIALVEASLAFVITVLFVLILGHYVVYWRAIWPAFSEPSDD